MLTQMFSVGDAVERKTGYRFPSIITSVDLPTFAVGSSRPVDPKHLRYVATVPPEYVDFAGMKHIFNGDQLRLRHLLPESEQVIPFMTHSGRMREAADQTLRIGVSLY